MKITPKSNIQLPSFPLPIYKSIKIGEALGKDGERFSIFIGLDKKRVAELKELSLDKSDVKLQKTSDFQRFGVGSYEDWYKKIRTPFVLVHTTSNKLAGLVFLGPENLTGSNDWHTAGWRSYLPFRGKGLMKDFGNFAMNAYLKKFPQAKFWVQIRKENTGSLSFAKNLDFNLTDISSPRGPNFLVMVKD